MILDRIAQVKQEEVYIRKSVKSLAELKAHAALGAECRPFGLALAEGNSIKVIAEIKKASPSKGVICPNFQPLDLALAYQAGGATAISVLTDASFFQGALEFLGLIKPDVELPLLRKDFIIDPYQIFESKVAGADAILLIARMLSEQQLGEFLALTQELGMEALVEIHDEADLTKSLSAGARIIGINNRDLATFHTDLKVTQELAPKVPKECIRVSESGIKVPADLAQLRPLGINAVLVGESLVTQADVLLATASLVNGGKP